MATLDQLTHTLRAKRAMLDDCEKNSPGTMKHRKAFDEWWSAKEAIISKLE